MLDPMIPLAFSLYSGKGTYALLLGSGISRSASIPTVWDIVIDLIQKIAKADKKECGVDPIKWYRDEYGDAPEYSKLLERLAPTQSARQQLLRAYFEPTEADRANGRKQPTKAHLAIAGMVRDGIIKVIITTNFDRLLEEALGAVGVTTDVISNEDNLKGAQPLVHSPVTIIKVNGDYLDSRIKNTQGELEKYDPAMDALLDSVFEDYGLIICGWSGEWDTALKAAIERCKSRRYSTYWADPCELKEQGKRLVEQRKAQLIKIDGADDFFDKLQDKVHALQAIDAPHPMSAAIAVATMKKYLPDPTAHIRLDDLVHEETERLVSWLQSSELIGKTNTVSADNVKGLVAQYDARCDVLLQMLITGGYYGSESTDELWSKTLSWLVESATAMGSGGDRIRDYPVLLLMYGIGIAAVARGKFSTLYGVLVRASYVNGAGIKTRLCMDFHTCHNGVLTGAWPTLIGAERHYTPGSEYLQSRLREAFRTYIPSASDYEDAFDRFEYYLGLVHSYFHYLTIDHTWNKLAWGPWGCFSWRNRRSFNSDKWMPNITSNELSQQGGRWPLLKAGFFDGSLEKSQTAVTNYNAFLSEITKTWF